MELDLEPSAPAVLCGARQSYPERHHGGDVMVWVKTVMPSMGGTLSC